MSRLRSIIIIGIIILINIPLTSVEAQTSLVEINSPGTSAIVSGVVPISGSAIDEDFRQYVLEFAPDPAVGGVWFAIQAPVAQQVQNGVLGAWDTSFVDDGRYLIRLRMIRHDGTESIDDVRVFVVNATQTPTVTATLTPTSTSTPDIAAPASGPTETPLIQQPPTRTPRPKATPGGPTATPRTLDLSEGPFQSEKLRGAAWSGVRLAFYAFGLLALYGIVRQIIRGEFVRGWRAFVKDFINPLINSIRGRK